jgi:2'-5' RNA ligase
MKLIYQINLCVNSRLESKLIRLTKRIAAKYQSSYFISKPYGPHITLFISNKNEIEEKHVPAIMEKLRSICTRTPGFRIGINGPGYFANSNKGKIGSDCVLYLKVDKSRQLNKLYKDVCNAMSEYANPAHSKFIPHMTIARGDLSLDNLYKAKRELDRRKVAYSYTLTSIVLLTKKRDNERWTRRYVRLR